MTHRELDDAARALYDAMPSRSYHPPWDQLGDVTKSVWHERVLEHPAAQEMLNLPPDLKRINRDLYRQISADCRKRAEECWRKHKAPMAAYWKANAVYARHISMLLR